MGEAPGRGWSAAALSSGASIHCASDTVAEASGLETPAGGISPSFSLRNAFSQMAGGLTDWKEIDAVLSESL
jgi:hypothetical protein